MKTLIALLLVGILSLVPLMPASAEDDEVYVEAVNSAGQTHLIRYPASRSNQLDTIRQALQKMMPALQVLWDGTADGAFRVFVDVESEGGSYGDWSEAGLELTPLPVPSGTTPWDGSLEATATTACVVLLYDQNTLYGDAALLRFELALDVARCYLQFYEPDSEGEEWLFEGLAHWQAVQVFDPPPIVLARLQKEYQDGYNSNLINTGSDAMYFWEFVLGGSVPTVSPVGLNALPDQDVLLTSDLFYAYAQAIAEQRLPWQPAASDLAQDESVDKLPDEVELDLEQNSIVLVSVALPSVESGQGIRIEGQRLSANETRAGLLLGAGYLDIPEGTSVELCSEELTSAVTVVAGRALRTDIAPPSVAFSLVKECKPKEKAIIPDCIVGTWNIGLPPEAQWIVTAGRYQMTFKPDGSFTEVMENYQASGAGAVLTINGIPTGNMTVAPDASTPRLYLVTDWTQTWQEASAILSQAGSTVDYTDMMTAPQSENLMFPPLTAIQCVQDGASNPGLLVTQVTAMGEPVPTEYTRVR